MDEVMEHSTARQSFQMLLLTIFGAVALLLAAIGIYGLMAYSVAQRTQEMGIRMALGADRSAILKLVIGHGISLALGVIVGVCAAFALTHLIASLLFGVKVWDAAAFICAPLILFAVALLARGCRQKELLSWTRCMHCAQSNQEIDSRSKLHLIAPGT